jgi:DNA-binding transcriptional LysR family regulator
MLARLEDELGQRLFDRGGGGSATPTIFARHIAEGARDILDASARLDREIRLLAGGELGRIRIGIGPSAKAFLLPHLVGGIIDRFPHLRLDLDVLPSDELFERLGQRRLDLIVGHFQPGLSFEGLVKTDLFEERAASIVRRNHPLTKLPGRVRWRDALAYPHVSTVRYGVYAIHVPRDLPGDAEQVLTAMRTADSDTAALLVATRDFVALASRNLFVPQLASGQFVELNFHHTYASWCSVVTTQEAAHFPVVEALVAISRQAAAHMARAARMTVSPPP